MKNTFGWMQLRTSDLHKAQSFYDQLFEWSLASKTLEGGEPYIDIDAGEGSCAGMSQGETKEPSHWVPFVNVKDIYAATEKAKSLGAQIIVPITDLGGEEGQYSVFLDPTGAVLGLYAPK